MLGIPSQRISRYDQMVHARFFLIPTWHKSIVPFVVAAGLWRQTASTRRRTIIFSVAFECGLCGDAYGSQREAG